MRIIKGKKTISFIAALLAALTLLPPQAAEAATYATTYSGSEDTGVYWTTRLPTDGDKSYHTDLKWYRLVLEAGNYSSNSVDSSGNYADTSPSDSSSWPFSAWHDSENGREIAASWIGRTRTEAMSTGTRQRTQDYSLYRNSEYSQDGMYSLYIKYAGKSKKTNEDCWYISPCDANGNREKKLWALDCCLDACEGDSNISYNSAAMTWECTGGEEAKSLSEGINPEFTLLTPTFEEFEGLDNFKYAGMATPYSYGWYNYGKITAAYNDNHKWIITQNDDGSWKIKSAGYIEWDWSSSSSGLAQNNDASAALADAAAVLAGTYIYEKYGSEAINNLRIKNFIQYRYSDIPISYGDEKEYFDIAWDEVEHSLYDNAWAPEKFLYGEYNYSDYESAAPNIALMLFLSDYAENVYITLDYIHRGTILEKEYEKAGDESSFGNKKEVIFYATNKYTHKEIVLQGYDDYRELMAAAGGGSYSISSYSYGRDGTHYSITEQDIEDYFALKSELEASGYKESRSRVQDLEKGENLFTTEYEGHTLNTGSFCTSYGMTVDCCELTAETVQKLQGILYYAQKTNGFIGSAYGIKTSEAASTEGVSKTNGYLSVDEIKAQTGLTCTCTWTPTKDDGAYTALYVGIPLKTQKYCEDNTAATVDSGVIKTLGAQDKNDDGVCDGAAYIGSFAEYACQNRTAVTGAPSITVEEGGTLQIDGPAYATAGTKITVKGSLVISSGAFLATEDGDTADLGTAAGGITLIIDGGSVIISGNSILDIGYADLIIKNGGELVNSGIFIQDTHKNHSDTAYISLRGGSIDNGQTAWFISGAEVLNKMRRTLISAAKETDGLKAISAYITDVDDFNLGIYAEKPFETYGLDTKVNFRMYQSETENWFRNKGDAFISGAIKGVTGGSEDVAGKISGCESLYRAINLYEYYAPDEAAAEAGFSFECHKARCTLATDSAGTIKATGDEVTVLYYSFTGLKTYDSHIVEDETGATMAEKSNIYALCVGTGAQGTSGISGFGIKYVDKTGKELAEYVNTADLKETYKFVSEWQYCGAGENESGTSKLVNGTDGIMSGGSFSASLEEMSNVVYLFQTSMPLSYVKSISFQGAGSGSWTCTELNIYKVSYIYPLEEYGWRSEDWYVPFSGSLIAETALEMDSIGVKSQTFTWDSQGIEIGTGLYQLNVYGVPENVKSRTDNSGFTYYNATTEAMPYSTADDEYTFAISLADTKDAGIESFYNNGTDVSLAKMLEDTGASASLEMQLTYIDNQGSARRITIPYIKSAMEWSYSSLDEDSRTAPIHGLFQQGEELVFRGMLPDYFKAYDASLSYTDAGSGDAIAVTAVSITKASYADVSVKDGMLVPEYPETATDFYCAPTTDGVSIMNGQTMSLSFKVWNGTESLKPKSSGSKFLVVVQTDSMSEAATKNNITVSFTYKTLSGLSSTTETSSLNQLVDDYCGYWLTSDGQEMNCAYRTAVCSGQQMYFVIEVTDLYTFTSATFSMPSLEDAVAGEGEDIDEMKKDNWQMSSITIYEVEEIGTRQVLLGTGISLADISTNRTYYRDNIFGSRGVINSAKGPLMIGPGQSKTIDFEKGSVTGGGEVVGRNKANGVEKLSYEETKQDFGFNSRRARYTVKVKVKGESITSVEDGDCGSQNQFYFQLVFQDEDGNLDVSPWVLSNQQLNSDGFRTGMEESFSVYTNDDFGTPVQINIIPDDTSSNSDVFDKLCIEYITVTRTSGTGVCLSWQADDVGWIDIEYKDDEEEQTGRTDEELMRSFELKDAGYSVRLEFGIETSAEYVDDVQFQGQVVADITYRDTSGVLKTESGVEIIPRIAEYAERLTELDEVNATGTDYSIPEYMFKNGYTNRFHYEFADISSLISIRFKATAKEEDCVWKVEQVFARQVFDEGTLSYNIFNEYERYYSIDPQDLTTSNNAKAVSVEAATDGGTAVTFNFCSGNSIKVNLDEDEEDVDIETGETEGKNDVISITAELTDTTGIAAGMSLPVKVIYKNIYGDAYAVNSTLVFDAESGKFMVPQNELPKTPDIGVPYQVEVTATDVLGGRQLEAVIVNQIRSSQVIEQFTFVPNAGTKLEAGKPITILLPESKQDEYAKKKGYTTEYQQLYILLGDKTEKTLLTDTRDLQVAMVYTEKDDPYGYEHISDYVSIMGSGYTVIESGTIITLTTNIGNVGSVKYLLLKTGDEGMKVNVERACISIEEKSNITSDTISAGWVNLPSETGLISTEDTFMGTDGGSLEEALASPVRVSPVNISASISDEGRSDAIMRVTVYYLDTQDNRQSFQYEQSVNEWNHKSACVLTSGLKKVQFFKVEVYDKDETNTACLTADKLTVSWYGTDGVYTTSKYKGDLELTEEEVKICSAINTKIKGTVTGSCNSQSVALEDNPAGKEGGYSVITLVGTGTVNVSATLKGLAGELEMFVLDSSGAQVGNTMSAGAMSDYLDNQFVPELNQSEETVRYTIHVRAKDMPDLYEAIVYVDVEPAVSITCYLLDSGGNMIGENMVALNGCYNDAGGRIFKAGDTITVYAKIANDPSGIAEPGYQPAGTELIEKIDIEKNVNYGIFGDGWNRYTITFSDAVTAGATGTFTLSSTRCPEVCYKLTFTVEPLE